MPHLIQIEANSFIINKAFMTEISNLDSIINQQNIYIRTL
jgi:hypothetical protein